MAQLVIALDVPESESALSLARELSEFTPWCKVGMELFTLAGPPLLIELKALGCNVFLDLKFYDIPHTVGRAALAAAAMGVDLLTLHCQGGARMCKTAREALADNPARPLLFGVTALTSFMPGEMPGIEAAPADFALSLAKRAFHWGLDGVVCSGLDAARIKKSCPELLCLCPGIRPAGAAADDQCRIVTPAEAVRAGADFLVVGRPVVQAHSPLAAAREILREMA
ncbi:MAG: orotidine-5'-phosphate decarboxylase [Desulfovibrio sp.]|jgi:orotidine-5'-phosphate decarboxylase|nr:orotidine-5'-phosphate decarboxylase [Desulfovibrio sp.]